MINYFEANRIRHNKTGKKISEIKRGKRKPKEGDIEVYKPWEDPEAVKRYNERTCVCGHEKYLYHYFIPCDHSKHEWDFVHSMKCKECKCEDFQSKSSVINNKK